MKLVSIASSFMWFGSLDIIISDVFSMWTLSPGGDIGVCFWLPLTVLLHLINVIKYCKFDCSVSIDVEIFDICSKEMFCASRMVPFCFSMKLSCSDNVWCFKNSWPGDFNVWQVWLGIGSWMISCSLLLIISMEDKRKFRLSDGSVSATTVR